MMFPTAIRPEEPNVMKPSPERKHCYIIPFDHPLVSLYPKALRQPILNILKDIDWREIGVYNYGRTEGEAEPTIVVVTSDKRKLDIISLGERVHEVCAENGAPDLKMVVIWGTVVW